MVTEFKIYYINGVNFTLHLLQTYNIVKANTSNCEYSEFTSGIRLIRHFIVPFLPIDQLDLQPRHRPANRTGAQIRILHNRSGATRLRQTVTLNQNHAQTGPNEVMGLRGQRGSSDQNEVHVTSEQGTDLVEDDFVANRGLFAFLQPVEFVLVAIVEDFLEGRTTFLYGVQDVFVDSIIKIQYERVIDVNHYYNNYLSRMSGTAHIIVGFKIEASPLLPCFTLVDMSVIVFGEEYPTC